MPLHDKDSVRCNLEDEVYASVDFSVSMPKYRFPARERDPRHAYSLPANRQDLSIQRILVRHGVSRDLGSLLVDDMKRAIEHFQQHPVQTPMAADEVCGFCH